MDTQVQRVVAWREQKRQEGYRRLTVWLKAEVKTLIEDPAARDRQDPAQAVSVAIQAYTGSHSIEPPPNYLDRETAVRLIQEQLRMFASQLTTQTPISDAPESSPAPEAISPQLLPGEYGATIQAVRTVARELGRFTC